MKRLVNTENKIFPVVFFIFLIVLWQAAVGTGWLDRRIIPSPIDVILAFRDIVPYIGEHVVVTLYEAFAGFALSILLSVVLALLMDNIPLVRKTLRPLLVLSQTIPIIALAPLFTMWFGFGRVPKILVVVLTCFFPIAISLADGLASVDQDMINLLKSMGAGKFQIARFLKFPAAVTSFFSGLRISATYSIMGAVIGEWLGGEKGLGIYMLRVRHSYAYDKMFAVIVVIIILSMLVFKLLDILKKVFVPWQEL